MQSAAASGGDEERSKLVQRRSPPHMINRSARQPKFQCTTYTFIMSLFASAFDGGPGLGAGPSSIPLGASSSAPRAKNSGSHPTPPGRKSREVKSPRAGAIGTPGQQVHPDRLKNVHGKPVKRQKKRKRAEPSHGDRLGDTQRNMAEVIHRLEAGGTEDRGDSRPMGMGSKQKKTKGNGSHIERKIGVKGPPSASKGLAEGKVKKGKRRDDNDVTPFPLKSPEKRFGPHSGRSGPPKDAVDSSAAVPRPDKPVDSDVDLTKMQKGMRSKLEEARFRSVGSRTFSIRSLM